MCSKILIVLGVLLIAIHHHVRSDTETETQAEVKTDAATQTPVIDRSAVLHEHHLDHHHNHHHDPTFHGFWKKKFVWRPRWVKTWQEKKIYVAVWKRMWGPVEVKEWVPVPKPPPGWIKHDVGSYVVNTHPHLT